MEAREFEALHKEEIAAALRGQGLAKLLSCSSQNAPTKTWDHQKYRFFNFGEAREPCKHCGKKYTAGIVYNSEKREQWIDESPCRGAACSCRAS